MNENEPVEPVVCSMMPTGYVVHDLGALAEIPTAVKLGALHAVP
jgi:hypothetical protein